MMKRWFLAAAFALAAVAAPAKAQSYTPPVDYCRAVGTIDKPDARYTGPKLPRWMAKQLNLTTGQSDQMEWRCASGKVLACVYGANIPCNAKANTNSTPTAACQRAKRNDAQIIAPGGCGRACCCRCSSVGLAVAVERGC